MYELTFCLGCKNFSCYLYLIKTHFWVFQTLKKCLNIKEHCFLLKQQCILDSNFETLFKKSVLLLGFASIVASLNAMRAKPQSLFVDSSDYNPSPVIFHIIKL